MRARLLRRCAGPAALLLTAMLVGCGNAPTLTSTYTPPEGPAARSWTGEVATPPPAAPNNSGRGGPISAGKDYVWPLRGEIVTRFMQSGSGVDIRAAAGQTVVAARSGRVNVFERTPEYGKVIVLDQEDGSATYYGRLGEILVAHGAWVKQGEAIARVASSSGAGGAELQFRVMENDQFVDPLRVLPR
jgi:murein DD-endopeptidase MepM/ murein hydrolase activator NlpD